MVYVSIHELEQKGLSLLEEIVSEEGDAIITDGGKGKYIVIDLEVYNRLKENEIETAFIGDKNDPKTPGKVRESLDDHIKRLYVELEP